MREQAALAKLGEIAAVVAHEVKNPIAGIRGVMRVFEKRLVHDNTSTQVLKDIVARIDSLDEMMEDLLLFARPPKPRRAPTDVAPLVATTASLLSEDRRAKPADQRRARDARQGAHPRGDRRREHDVPDRVHRRRPRRSARRARQGVHAVVVRIPMDLS